MPFPRNFFCVIFGKRAWGKAQFKQWKMKTQFITDDNGKKLAIILPMKEYTRMLEDLEELEDIKLYDKAKNGKQHFKDAKDVFMEIEEKRKQA